MSDYQLTSDPDTIQRTSDGAFIPNDNRNMDWNTYLVWLKEDGNEPDPAPAPPPVARPSLTADSLASILVKKAIISQSDIESVR